VFEDLEGGAAVGGYGGESEEDGGEEEGEGDTDFHQSTRRIILRHYNG